ncbi:sensor histidine kinase [Chitinilyticum piscinae]|uniref:histidine kinase n=1 Tax=Chitinilyticum piscinae TaxID=2866724 RepID=A0A8J7FM36_9NEIS|nr:ATP-binding protein [Chitinilyticum piscinae]MBE9610607.1 HAMP domain-containing protein [Chitinilyticum piscinae]
MKRLLFVFAALGSVLLFLLALAAGNASAFSDYYDLVLGLNVLLLGGMAALVIGHLWRLRKRVRSKVFGSRLMLRLVLMFGLVAVLPGALVYTLSVQFLNRSIETWFDVKVDKALDRGWSLGQNAIDFQQGELARKAQVIAWDIHDNSDSTLLPRLNKLRDQTGVQEITIFDELGNTGAHIGNEKASLFPQQPDRASLRRASYEPVSKLEENAEQGLNMRVLVVIPGTSLEDKRRYLQLIQPVPQQLAQDAELVTQVRSEYKQLSSSRQGLKTIFSITLTIALLVSLLGALVLALYLSNKLAAPLSLLAAGTRAVAQGDFSQQQPVVSRDELGILTHSFNRMTRQLAETRAKLEQNQAEQAAAKAYVEAILGSISAGVLSFDEDCLLQSTNLSALRILGLDPAKVEGLPLGRWHEPYPVLTGFCAEILRGVLSDNDHWQSQVELNGDKRVMLVHGTRLSGMPEDFTIMGGFVVVFDDITELLSAQRDAAWGEVARRLAHEIKNPLTPIQLAAERMELKLADKLEPQAAELLSRNTQTIVKQVAALKQMVDAFRDYARKPSGKRQVLDFAELLREVLVLYEAAPIERHLLTTEPLPIKGDATHLRQVIHNLLQNAQDAIRESTDPKVCIRCEKDEKWLRFSIADNGPGFSSELLPRVFEPYVTTKTKGTGLGLAIVKKIIEEHHGRIQVGNQPEGGAFVRIELPLWEEV